MSSNLVFPNHFLSYQTPQPHHTLNTKPKMCLCLESLNKVLAIQIVIPAL